MLIYDYGNSHQELYIPEKSVLTLYQPWAAERCEDPKIFNRDDRQICQGIHKAFSLVHRVDRISSSGLFQTRTKEQCEAASHTALRFLLFIK
jgi:hypothetical protein